MPKLTPSARAGAVLNAQAAVNAATAAVAFQKFVMMRP
jgi:hypothetical protein